MTLPRVHFIHSGWKGTTFLRSGMMRRCRMQSSSPKSGTPSTAATIRDTWARRFRTAVSGSHRRTQRFSSPSSRRRALVERRLSSRVAVQWLRPAPSEYRPDRASSHRRLFGQTSPNHRGMDAGALHSGLIQRLIMAIPATPGGSTVCGRPISYFHRAANADGTGRHWLKCFS